MFLLPTLNRPKLLEKCLNSIKNTSDYAPIMVLIDENDPAINEYKNMLPVDQNVQVLYTKGVTMAEKVKEAWPGLGTGALDFIGIINDDFEFVTEGWDDILLSYLDGKNFVSSNDRVQRSWIKPSGVTVWSKPLLDCLGWNSFFPPGLQHLYVDDVWLRLGTATGSWRMAADCVVLHNHVLDGKMAQDSTFHKTYDDFFAGKSRDAGVFELYMKHDFQKDVEKIMAFQDYLPGEQQNPRVLSK